jgi:hypothetical protein
MHKRLAKLWRRLNCRVVSRFGSDRRVINAAGVVICEGGYQAELNYILIRYPEMINQGAL